MNLMNLERELELIRLQRITPKEKESKGNAAVQRIRDRQQHRKAHAEAVAGDLDPLLETSKGVNRHAILVGSYVNLAQEMLSWLTISAAQPEEGRMDVIQVWISYEDYKELIGRFTGSYKAVGKFSNGEPSVFVHRKKRQVVLFSISSPSGLGKLPLVYFQKNRREEARSHLKSEFSTIAFAERMLQALHMTEDFLFYAWGNTGLAAVDLLTANELPHRRITAVAVEKPMHLLDRQAGQSKLIKKALIMKTRLGVEFLETVEPLAATLLWQRPLTKAKILDGQDLEAIDQQNRLIHERYLKQREALNKKFGAIVLNHGQLLDLGKMTPGAHV
ncbi:MAG: hypothetical protein D6698_03620, partial [Gammaproteobacteria bacterium]